MAYRSDRRTIHRIAVTFAHCTTAVAAFSLLFFSGVFKDSSDKQSVSQPFVGDAVVAVPDSPTEIERFAASELAGELGKCLGKASLNAPFANDLAEWRRVAGGNLFIWDYMANFSDYMMPHPNIGSIEKYFMSMRKTKK